MFTRHQFRCASLHLFNKLKFQLAVMHKTLCNNTVHDANWIKLFTVCQAIDIYGGRMAAPFFFNLHHAPARLPPHAHCVQRCWYFPGHKNCDWVAQFCVDAGGGVEKSSPNVQCEYFFPQSKSNTHISHPAERPHNAPTVYWKMQERMIPTLSYTRGHFFVIKDNIGLMLLFLCPVMPQTRLVGSFMSFPRDLSMTWQMRARECCS